MCVSAEGGAHPPRRAPAVTGGRARAADGAGGWAGAGGARRGQSRRTLPAGEWAPREGRGAGVGRRRGGGRRPDVARSSTAARRRAWRTGAGGSVGARE